MARGKSGAAPRPVTLGQRVATRDPVSLWALVCAAGASPTCRTVWPRVGHLAHAVLVSTAHGRGQSQATEAKSLLDACVRDAPRLVHVEDFVPFDPRDEVWARSEHVLGRLFPGSVERPVADISRARLVAEITDDFLCASHGFGITDLVDATLAHINLAVETFSSAWAPASAPADERVSLSQDEIDAAGVVNSMAALVGNESASRKAALDWVTHPARRLKYDFQAHDSTFGSALRVRAPWADSPLWLPLAFLPESLGVAVSKLASEAAQDVGARRGFAAMASREVLRCLWRFSTRVLGTDDPNGVRAVSPENVVQWVAMLGEQRAVVVQIVAELDVVRLSDRLVGKPMALQVSEAAASVGGEFVDVPMPGRVLKLRRGIEVVPLLVTVTPGHIVAPRGPGMFGMTLEDLQWAAQTAKQDSDLFMFCREQARRGLRLMSFEAIDVWNWWQSNAKSMSTSGHTPDLLVVEPHSASAEWNRHRNLAPLERALFDLEFPDLTQLDAVEDDARAPMVFWREAAESLAADDFGDHPEPDLMGWAIHIGDPPVAVQALKRNWGPEAGDFLHRLGGGMVFGLAQICNVWRRAHANSVVDGYRVMLTVPSQEVSPDPGCATSHTPLKLESVSSGSGGPTVLDVVASVQFVDTEHDLDSFNFRLHTAMAELFAALCSQGGATEEAADGVRKAWVSAPHVVKVWATAPATVRNKHVRPIAIDEALMSEMERLVAETVAAAEVEPGSYFGKQANAIDRDVLAPVALDLLTARLSQFSTEDIVRFGMVQLERNESTTRARLRHVEQSAGSLTIDWDPNTSIVSLHEKSFARRRAIETVIEASLREDVHGNRVLDELAWGEVLAAALEYLNATVRSEQLHYQVNPTYLEISDSYELLTKPYLAVEGAGGSDDTVFTEPSGSTEDLAVSAYDIDMKTFHRLRAVASLEEALNRDASTAEGGDGVGDERADELADDNAAAGDSGVAASQEMLAELEQPMLDAYGAAAIDILTVLLVLVRWPLAEDDDDAITVERDVVLEFLSREAILGAEAGGVERLDRALTMLTLTHADLTAADWRPWQVKTRRDRLLVRPIPLLPDGRLVVAPHYVHAAFGVYQGYLGEGALPWTQPAPPKGVSDALAAIRQRRNEELEVTVASTLRSAGWTVIERVRPGKGARIGVPELTTEIDVIAARDGDEVVWLLEVKDPTSVFGVPELRRHLDRFFRADGKRPSYETQLTRKESEVAPFVINVRAALGLGPLPEGQAPRLETRFVTRRMDPAGFASSRFEFLTVDDLSKAIASLGTQPAASTWAAYANGISPRRPGVSKSGSQESGSQEGDSSS